MCGISPTSNGPRIKRSIGSSLTQPPLGLNLNECGTESGVTAPQARNSAFLGHTSVKISFIFPFPIYQAPGATPFWTFLWGGRQMICCPLQDFGGHGRIAPPPPGSASGHRVSHEAVLGIITSLARQCTESHSITMPELRVEQPEQHID